MNKFSIKTIVLAGVASTVLSGVVAPGADALNMYPNAVQTDGGVQPRTDGTMISPFLGAVDTVSNGTKVVNTWVDAVYRKENYDQWRNVADEYYLPYEGFPVVNSGIDTFRTAYASTVEDQLARGSDNPFPELSTIAVSGEYSDIYSGDYGYNAYARCDTDNSVFDNAMRTYAHLPTAERLAAAYDAVTMYNDIEYGLFTDAVQLTQLSQRFGGYDQMSYIFYLDDTAYTSDDIRRLISLLYFGGGEIPADVQDNMSGTAHTTEVTAADGTVHTVEVPSPADVFFQVIGASKAALKDPDSNPLPVKGSPVDAMRKMYEHTYTVDESDFYEIDPATLPNWATMTRFDNSSMPIADLIDAAGFNKYEAQRLVAKIQVEATNAAVGKYDEAYKAAGFEDVLTYADTGSDSCTLNADGVLSYDDAYVAPGNTVAVGPHAEVNFDYEVTGPEGWNVTVDGKGRVTAQVPVGTKPGVYDIAVAGTSSTDGRMVDTTTVRVHVDEKITNFHVNDDGDLVVVYADGTEVNLGHVRGADGVDGVPGKDGVDGKDGANGADGQDGAQGPRGEQGPKGDKGDTGDTGAPGRDGKDGVDGRDGTNGKDGRGIKAVTIDEQGNLVVTYTDAPHPVTIGKVTGDDGKTPEIRDGRWFIGGTDTGVAATGRGVQSVHVNDAGELVITLTDGTTVNAGHVTGRDGVDGKDGKDGTPGPKGDKGDKGDKGEPGADGHDGAPGRDGNDGADGIDGQDGAQGPKGDKGEQGPKGDKGDKGDKGEPGENGRDGADGAPGRDGADGAPGRDGADGKDGAPGPKGDKGDKGDKGEPGNDGRSITDIRINSAGELEITYSDSPAVLNLGKITGPAGRPGTPGTPGEPGRGIANTTVNDAGEFVVTYTDGTTTNLGNITGPQGDKGDKGDRGDVGAPGRDGSDGANAVSPQITVTPNANGTLTFTVKQPDGTTNTYTVVDGDAWTPAPAPRTSSLDACVSPKLAIIPAFAALSYVASRVHIPGMDEYVANMQRQIGVFNPDAAKFVRDNQQLLAAGLAGIITVATLFAPGVCGDASIADTLAKQ